MTNGISLTKTSPLMILLAIILHVCQCLLCCSKMFEHLYQCQQCMQVLHQDQVALHALEFHQLKSTVYVCQLCNCYHVTIERLQHHYHTRHHQHRTPFQIFLQNMRHVAPFMQFQYCQHCDFKTISITKLVGHITVNHWFI